ncbi:Putative SWF/SNF family helicase [endosymbiont DhMRE of Dentiscutata heterogama]|uniref:DEAD/DEAH box helicase n=1 Tax=endosymbiont DhMRE of Dentiscutata heterogama TaxID=1609546 RepID=UPI000629DC77|nr:DEAD/DEAH box helicase [endosymbiont DhMRE of Dentiscutata heterogama]CFW93469.1 Putative SWF/SNF family helicase [endosymbiont DhMRE of Dentiscutata heterogama]
MKKTEVEIVETNSQKIIFKTTYSWAFCLGANQESKLKHYSLPANPLNSQKLQKIVSNYDFSATINSVPTNDTQSPSLRDYQLADVKFLSRLKSVAIFSEMRTGKTPIALKVFQQWPVNNLLIITPSVLQQQWQKSVEEWLRKPAYIITYLDKKSRYDFYQKLLSEPELIITVSKDTFKIDSPRFKKIKKKWGTNHSYCVIVDEAHFLRNHQSQQSKSIYTLKDAPYKMALTGTPVVNRSADIFGILKFLYPETYSSYWRFAEQYFYIYKSEIRKGKKVYKIFRVQDFKNEQARRELQEKISQLSVNRRQKEVLPWLPPVIYQKEYLLMEEKQQLVYSQWREKWKDYQPLEVLANLKTLTLYPPALGLPGSGSKINYLVDFLKERKGQNIIIFSTRSETFLEPLATALAEKKITTGLIIGKTNFQEREENINKFQNGTLDILLCNIQSAGMGLNLSRAETIIFADRSYSPADNEQAEARFLPTTNSEPGRVRLVIDLICQGTIDEKILQLLKRKEDIIKVLNSNPGYFFS